MLVNVRAGSALQVYYLDHFADSSIQVRSARQSITLRHSQAHLDGTSHNETLEGHSWPAVIADDAGSKNIHGLKLLPAQLDRNRKLKPASFTLGMPLMLHPG